MPDLHIVIRTNGERTAGLCRELAEAQAGSGEVEVVAERPFFAAVRRTFALGADSGADRLLALDADVLLFPGAVDYINRIARTYGHPELVRIDFTVRDKFRGQTCAGAHLYNNAWSKKILKHLGRPGADKVLRAESDNVISYCRAGGLAFCTITPQWPVGLHDHAQFQGHLLHKYRTRKERCKVDLNGEGIVRDLRRGVQEHPGDADWRMALEGMTGDPRPNEKEVLDTLGLAEKQPLETAEREGLTALLGRYALPDRTCA